MDVVTVRGDAYGIGRGLGERAAPVVRDVVFATAQFRALMQWLGSDRLAGVEAAARKHFPEFVREIEGIADGAGVDFADAFLWNCRGDLRGLAGAAEDSCTTVMLPAADGRPAVIGHNEDGAPEFAGHGFLARVEPDRGMAFTAFCYPGMLAGHAFAVNDAGLVQTINNIRPHDLVVGIPRHVVSRAVLTCRSLDDALDLLRREDRASGFHHNLGDAASGRLLSVEAPASGCVVVEAAEPMVHANHLVRREFAELDQTVTASSQARHERAAEMVMAGAAAEGDPLAILFDRGREELPVLCRGETGSSDSYTLATVVYRLGAGRVDWSVHHGPERQAVYEERRDTAGAARTCPEMPGDETFSG